MKKNKLERLYVSAHVRIEMPRTDQPPNRGMTGKEGEIKENKSARRNEWFSNYPLFSVWMEETAPALPSLCWLPCSLPILKINLAQ